MNRHFQLVVYPSFFFWFLAGYANVPQPSQDTLNPDSKRHLEDMEEFFEELQNSSSKDSLTKFIDYEDGKIIVEFDSLTKSKYLEAYQGYLQNNIMNYRHSQQVFKWQLTSSKLIFATVIILVMAGIIFSGLQFKRGSHDSRTELEFSRNGIKVSSSILGVIILVISLVFFYLYLVYVYPIQEIF